ncbi:hypothetical protein [Nocardioides sambongensis]|uniref:hypothetical protein n=1 Tax=Nocardioides sambongensis TaxID=2589074 RepID=UPI00112ECFE2|nr:hypothetical protein [Nocardioides sambongensis]
MTYDGGVLVLDARSGEVLLDEEREGFLRLNPAGDDRHVLISATGGFAALDLASWTEAHGDHGHSWTSAPRMTDFTIAAEEPGHVVVHDGITTTFDDATGVATSYAGAGLADAIADGQGPETAVHQAAEAHHGVAVVDGHGNVAMSVGDEVARSGLALTTSMGAELAASDACPGLHGEATAGDTLLFGCEDGALILDGTTITKVDAPGDYGRIGNQAGHDTSRYVLGDFKVDPDAELERPRRVSVVDTRAGVLDLVDLPASYSFRSLGRTPDGDGLVLGADGVLRRIDMARAEVVQTVAVTEPWREPRDWQQPRPTLAVVGDRAYVTDPAREEIHVVDLRHSEVVDSLPVPQTPNEILGVTG